MGLGGEARTILVEFIGDARALKAATAEGEAALTGFGAKSQAVGKIAGKVLAGGLLLAGAAAYEAGKTAAEDEAAQAQLEQQLKNNTKATQEQIDAVDEWIVKQAEAKGVAVDDLRPAMAKLATATGSVAKSQRLLSIAMDVSAGSGKDLGSITAALVKAQNGSVGGLARLGVATKDASGHTMTFNQILKAMADKYQGDAAKAAETTAGKQRILGVELHELAVKIGTAVLPAMQALTRVGLASVGWLTEHTRTAGVLVGALFGLLAITVAVGAATKVAAAAQAIWSAATWAAGAPSALLNTNLGIRLQLLALDAAAWVRSAAATVASTVASTAAAAATKVMAAAQWLLNAALDANPVGLVVLAIAALVGGLILAYRHSETFRAIVDKTFSFIGKVVPQVIGAVVDFVKNHWGLLVSIIGGPVAIVAVQVIKHFDTIKSIVSSVVGFVVDKAKDFGRFASEVNDHVADVVKFFVKLPGKITDALAGLPGQLKSIGASLIEGLVHGIEAGAGKVESAVMSLVNKIPKKIRDLWGINSPAKVAIPLGEALPEGIAVGMERGTSKAESAAQKMTDKLKSRLSTLKDAFKSLKDSVSQAFTGDLFQASSASEFVSNLTARSGQLSALKNAFKTLLKWGWKPQALAALFQSGNAGLILDLAANQGLAQQGAGLYNDVTSMADSLGGQAGQAVYGDQINHLQNQLAGGDKGGGGNARTTVNATVNLGVVTDPVAAGREIVKAVRQLERATGRQLLVSNA